MARRASLKTCLGRFALSAFVAATVVMGLRHSRDAVRAAPHTISRHDHPYDPDWPDVYLILLAKCVGCHRPGTDRTDFTTYDSLVDGVDASGERVVVSGRPQDSMLWRNLAWNHAARLDSELPDEPLMPEAPEEWLTGGQLDTVERWIANGALEYALPDTCSPRPLIELDYPSAKQCRTCHPKQYDEWSRSMHAYAQHSPILEAFNLTLIERTSGTIGTFCTRCHTPLGTALGENGSRRNVHRSQLSMEGVTCVVCHRQKNPYYKSNARTAIVPGQLNDACMYGPFSNPVRLPVETHPATSRQFIRTSAFCGECHDVTNPAGVRLEEAFSEWQNSPAAEQGITCHQCHMGPVPGRPVAERDRPWGRAADVPGVDPELIPLRPLSNHTFAGPDYSLLPDTEFPYKLDWMYECDYRLTEELTPQQRETLDDLRRRNRRQLRLADNARYQLLKNAARIEVSAPRAAMGGTTVPVQVAVISTTAGHSFPTGFTPERQAWLEVTLVDPLGRVVFASGDLDRNGDLRDEHSHEVELGKLAHDEYLLNLQNRFVALTNRGTERPVVLSINRHLQPINILRPAAGISASFGRPATFRIGKGSLPPLATVHQDYPIHVPDCPGDYLLRVRLNFRHLPPALLDAIGTPHLKHLLEIVVIDEYQSVVRIGPGTSQRAARLFP